ncbi:aspartate/glutamate racemase family protein [Streptomyces sp. NPDC058613]|uniref:aspartate/glutamate racemase family protein n=1 Tax=Streptomyces sp. NPDC058613 TaxID=3346556 RepID=UPI00366911D2
MNLRTPVRTLGVLGGMGPSATAEFLRVFATKAPATTDQEHPRVILLSDPGIPDRTASLVAGDEAPLVPLREGLHTLAGWGAGLLAVPCNTAHAFIDRFRAELPVPVVHIIDATLLAAMRTSPEGSWLAATTGTVLSGLYQRRAEELGHPLFVPGGDVQELVHEASVLIKAGRSAAAGAVYAEAVRNLREKIDAPVLAACTELPLAHAAAGLPAEQMVSSLDALADACLAELYR